MLDPHTELPRATAVAPRKPHRLPRSAGFAIALGLFALLDGVGAQSPPPLSLVLVDPRAPGQAPAPGAPFEIHLEGPSGFWVVVLAHASYAPTSATSLEPTELAAFYATCPWATPPVPSVVEPGTLLAIASTLGVPSLTLAQQANGIWPAGAPERARAQPLLAAIQGALPFSTGAPRRWDTACPSWTAHPETAATSIQSLWRSALYAASEYPDQAAVNTTLFDPYLLGDCLFIRQAGGQQIYDDFLLENASFLISEAFEVRLTFQAAAFASLPHFQPASSEPATAGFEPTDPDLEAVLAILSQTSAVGYSIGAPSTGIRHPGYTLNGIPIQPVVTSTGVIIPGRGAMYPDPILTLEIQGTPFQLTGRFLAPGWMRFSMPAGQVLPAGASVTITRIENAVGPMPGLLAGSPEPVSWGMLPVFPASP